MPYVYFESYFPDETKYMVIKMLQLTLKNRLILLNIASLPFKNCALIFCFH